LVTSKIRGDKKMSFHSLITEHIKEEVTLLLKNSSRTSEYYIDRVLRTLSPDCLYIALYTASFDVMKQYLIDNGFQPEISNNPNNITMVYKDIVNIKIMTNHEEYDVEKIRNFKISSITLNHVIKQMAKNGYKLQQVYADLEELAKHK
jgi:hypothetical protein